jgi:biofilm PGA synthesis lipoprotein PgaB
MKLTQKILELLIIISASLPFGAWAGSSYRVLSFHDIVPTTAAISEIDDVTVDNLVNYFSWLRESGYRVVSVQDILNAQNGRQSLPDKAILLTFDDGYKSFYTHVFPLLKAFQYPATLAIVGSWLETPDNKSVTYGDKKVARTHFLSLAELKELSQSPLIEIASHTYDLHHGIIGNAEGNLMPALTTLAFDAQTKNYESTLAYQARVKNDLIKNNRWLKARLGKSPRVVVWPYGRYNTISEGFANDLGMAVKFTLDDGENLDLQALNEINRIYVIKNPTLASFANLLRNNETNIQRVMHVDLDYIYDPDPEQQEKNLGLLLERIKLAGVSVVYLQAFADEDGNGVAKSLYFPNRNLPMKANLFGRVSWQIRTRLGVNVYAWMPLLAFNPGLEKLKNLDVVSAVDNSKGIGYLRLSPFSQRSRQFIREIYEDLSKYTYFYGIVIHDDATLSDQEDASQAALAYYAKEWGLPPNIKAIQADPKLNEQWARHKTEVLTKFALEMKTTAEQYRKPLKMARNYYAEVALNPESETWLAQSMSNALANFDWVALEAMPYMENAPHPQEWLNTLVEKVQAIPGANQKTIFELQAKNWRNNTNISNQEIMGWMRELRIQGAVNFGYYPDNPFINHPDLELIKRELSTQSDLQ